MTKKSFEDQKEELLSLINAAISSSNPKQADTSSLLHLVAIINQYSFEDRLRYRGLITRTIIDSLELDDVLGDKLIQFDQNIN